MHYAYQACKGTQLIEFAGFVGRIRRSELNPKTWTVSVNRLFDAQSGILPD